MTIHLTYIALVFLLLATAVFLYLTANRVIIFNINVNNNPYLDIIHSHLQRKQ
jgi:hypothetical protein